MRNLISIFSLFLILFFASCEDKQSSSKNASKTTSENEVIAPKNSKLDSLKAIYAEKEKIVKSDTTEADDRFPIPQEKLIPFLTQYGKENPENRVRISTNFGDMEVMLYRDTPLHRANFIMLVKKGYFDNTYFHRVAPGFVIQGGNSDNISTPRKRSNIGDYLIPSEFNAGHKHTYGAFSAAKYSEQNVSKASSPFEFFIVMDKNGTPHLNNDHTVFGRVTKGMDVAEKIAKVKTGQSEWPINNVEMEVKLID